MNSTINLAVAIIYFEKFDQTVECIQSVCSEDCNVYVLNNNSSKKYFSELKEIFRNQNNIIFINSNINLGPSKGRNYLIKSIKEDWIFFLDNDITVTTQNWLQIITKYILKYQEKNVFIPRLYNVHENRFLQFHTYSFNCQLIQSHLVYDNLTNCFPGGAACVKKELFEDIGGYSEEITALEDFEFSIRALLRGTPIRGLLVEELTLFHDHRFSGTKEDQFASKVRYKAEQFSIAEQYIRDKHGIVFYSGWKPWVDEQLALLVDKDRITVVKEKLTRLFKRAKNSFFKKKLYCH